MIKALILGGNGFIGHHMARSLKKNGYWIRTVDIKEYEYGNADYSDDYLRGDLRCYDYLESVILKDGIHFDEVYSFAAWMGGAGVIFTGDYDS